MSRFAHSISRNCLELRVVTVITSPQITQPVRRGTMKSRFLNPGPYVSPLDRSRSFPIERVDTIHVADNAARSLSNNEHHRERLFVPFLLFESPSVTRTILPWNKDGRSPIGDRTARAKSRRKRKHTAGRSGTLDVTRRPLPRRGKYFDWITSSEFRSAVSFARYL